MKKINIKAKIKRNKLDAIAGEDYRDENSDIVKHLNRSNKKAFLGIQRKDGIYTLIGEDAIYYSTAENVECRIGHKCFLEILEKNALNTGKTGQFEFLRVNDRDFIWLRNVTTMNALWNTVLALSNN